MWPRRLASTAAAAGLLLAGCGPTTPDEPAPPPDDGSASDEPDDGGSTDGEGRPEDGRPEDDPGVDDDPPQDDPPQDDPAALPAVELTAWVDEAPANLNHRIEGTVTDDSGEGEFGAPVRFEVHRDETIVLAVDRQTEADGEVLFSYNAAARPGDTDVVVACALDPGGAVSGDAEPGTDEPEAVTSLCTEEADQGGDEPAEGPTVDPAGASVTVRWGEERQADPDPAGSDFFGEAIAIEPDEQLLEVQLLPRDADLGSFVAFGYTDDADYEVDDEPVSMETFACAVQRTVEDDAAEQRLTISLTPPEVMRYLLTSSTDVDACS